MASRSRGRPPSTLVAVGSHVATSSKTRLGFRYLGLAVGIQVSRQVVVDHFQLPGAVAARRAQVFRLPPAPRSRPPTGE